MTDVEKAPLNRVFFGHHKCASRFFRLSMFKRIAESIDQDVVSYAIENPPYHFSDLPDLDLDMVDYGRVALGGVVVNLLNASPAVLDKVSQANANFRGLRVVRDPRSILVSAYFHHRGSHPLRSTMGFVWDKLVLDRPILDSLSEEDGLIYELENITGSVISDQILAWPGDARVMNCRVEDINADRPAFLDRLAEHLRLEAIPPIDWSKSFSDSGGGDWRAHFTPRLKDIFKARFGRALIELGYERTADW